MGSTGWGIYDKAAEQVNASIMTLTDASGDLVCVGSRPCKTIDRASSLSTLDQFAFTVAPITDRSRWNEVAN